MPTHTAHLRQRSLLEYLAWVRGRVMPFADIRRYLESQPFSADFGREYSQRTLQRDIQCIAATYEEEIKTGAVRDITWPGRPRQCQPGGRGSTSWPSCTSC